MVDEDTILLCIFIYFLDERKIAIWHAVQY